MFEIGASSKDIKGTVEAMMNGTYKPVLKTVVADCGKVVLKTGSTAKTLVTASMSDDSFYNIADAAITYTSSNKAVASVDNTGLVTAAGPGVTTITAKVTIDGLTKTDSYPVKVMADLDLLSIETDGKKISSFKPEIHAYSFLAKNASADTPQVSARPAVAGTEVGITQAASIPGTALITLTDNITGQVSLYAVNHPSVIISRQIHWVNNGAGSERTKTSGVSANHPGAL